MVERSEWSEVDGTAGPSRDEENSLTKASRKEKTREINVLQLYFHFHKYVRAHGVNFYPWKWEWRGHSHFHKKSAPIVSNILPQGTGESPHV